MIKHEVKIHKGALNRKPVPLRTDEKLKVYGLLNYIDWLSDGSDSLTINDSLGAARFKILEFLQTA